MSFLIDSCIVNLFRGCQGKLGFYCTTSSVS